eukprot:Em0001g435a
MFVFDVKAFDSKPLPGYSVFPDPAAFQIRLVHKSKRKDLCETFKLDNQVDFDHWVEALRSVSRWKTLVYVGKSLWVNLVTTCRYDLIPVV